ncbi:dsaVM [Symbiodinium natans]|uniref:DsaVM protein n=1 Tax=Symbiodinium natans TaxID=878477 RepID=A0A812LWK7_9DINO|nr:dsaVM [Symbiodinium natans]
MGDPCVFPHQAALTHLCCEYSEFSDIDRIETAPGRPPNQYFYIRTKSGCGCAETGLGCQDYFVRSGEEDRDLRLRHDLLPRVAKKLAIYNQSLRTSDISDIKAWSPGAVFVTVPEPISPSLMVDVASDGAGAATCASCGCPVCEMLPRTPRVKSLNGLSVWRRLMGFVDFDWEQKHADWIAGTCAGIAAFNAALQDCSCLPCSDISPEDVADRVKVPEWVKEHKNHWDEADDLDYLLDHVRPMLSDLSFLVDAAGEHGVLVASRALALLVEHRKAYKSLPKQLTHGDLGLGNVMISPSSENATVCIIDFTPYATESHLYAFTVTLYWTFLYGPLSSAGAGGTQDAAFLDEERLRAAVAAYLTTADLYGLPDVRHMWYTMFVKVACRMLFVPVLWASSAEVEGAALPSFVCAEATEKYVRVLDWVMANRATLQKMLDLDVDDA